MVKSTNPTTRTLLLVDSISISRAATDSNSRSVPSPFWTRSGPWNMAGHDAIRTVQATGQRQGSLLAATDAGTTLFLMQQLVARTTSMGTDKDVWQLHLHQFPLLHHCCCLIPNDHFINNPMPRLRSRDTPQDQQKTRSRRCRSLPTLPNLAYLPTSLA